MQSCFRGVCNQRSGGHASLRTRVSGLFSQGCSSVPSSGASHFYITLNRKLLHPLGFSQDGLRWSASLHHILFLLHYLQLLFSFILCHTVSRVASGASPFQVWIQQPLPRISLTMLLYTCSSFRPKSIQCITASTW